MNKNVIKKPEKGEPRIKRLPILLRPSVYSKLKEKCESIGISMNECINQLVENWVEK